MLISSVSLTLGDSSASEQAADQTVLSAIMQIGKCVLIIAFPQLTTVRVTAALFTT